MAIIDLKCTKCSHSFEELVKNGEYPPCPKCGAKTAQNYAGLKTPAYKKGCAGNCSSCAGCGK